MMEPILDLDLLRTFVMVARTGELKKAAQSVCRSQGAVSMQMKRLEELTGNCLLERSNRGIRLTDAGETLLSYSEQMLKLSGAALSALSGKDLTGQLRFGIPTDYAQDFINFFLPVLSAEVPNLEARIICDRSRNLRKLVSRGKLDIAIVAAEPEYSDELMLWSERLVWAASIAAHPEQVSPLPVAMLEDNCIVRDLCREDLQQSGLPFRTVFGSPVLDNIVTAVELGQAISLLPESLLTHKTRILPNELIPSQRIMQINMISADGVNDSVLNRVSACFRVAIDKKNKSSERSQP